MKTIARILLVILAATLLPAATCHAQNGPTPPSVKLSWTQSTAPGVTANCVYRGAAAGTYALPALYCSTIAIATYTDTTVTRGTTYHYAVTAQVGSQESAYSNDATAVVPATITPPTVQTPPVETKLDDPTDRIVLRAKVVR
jgi:cellulose 1,4-beta-cellobiosidase